MLRIGVTRDGSQLVNLINKAAEANIEIIPLPLIKTESVRFNWPDNLISNNIDWLIFTSANGVKNFFDRLLQLEISLPKSVKIAVVGFKTEVALFDYNLKADFLPSEMTGDILFSELLDQFDLCGKTVVYPKARFVHNDPAQLFNNSKVNYFPIVCYQTEECQLQKSKLAQLKNGDYILFTAPSAVSSYARQFNQPHCKIAAIGPTTADAMNNFNWNIDLILDKPDINRVLEFM